MMLLREFDHLRQTGLGGSAGGDFLSFCGGNQAGIIGDLGEGSFPVGVEIVGQRCREQRIVVPVAQLAREDLLASVVVVFVVELDAHLVQTTGTSVVA